MLLLHCLLVVTGPVPWSSFNMELVIPPQSSWLSHSCLQLLLSKYSLLSKSPWLSFLLPWLSFFPIKQIVPQTSHSRLPSVMYWLCHFVCIMSSHHRPARRRHHYLAGTQVWFQLWWRLPELPALLCYPSSSCTSAYNEEVPSTPCSRFGGRIHGEGIHTLQSCK